VALLARHLSSVCRSLNVGATRDLARPARARRRPQHRRRRRGSHR
jgi:hypothetical protein